MPLTLAATVIGYTASHGIDSDISRLFHRVMDVVTVPKCRDSPKAVSLVGEATGSLNQATGRNDGDQVYRCLARVYPFVSLGNYPYTSIAFTGA